jgi:ketosteroid isomerase-like protein
MSDNVPGNVELVQQVYDAVGARDLETFASLLDANVEWRLAESDGLPFTVDNPYVGPDAVLAKLAEVGQVLAYEHTVDEFFDAGDVIVVTGVYDGLYRPTATAFTTPFVHVWRVRDGKIVGLQQYVDAAPVVKAASQE